MLNYAQMQNSTMTRIVLLPASFRKKQRARPRRQKTEHLHSTVISVMILKTQCYGNIDDNIQYHINGSSYMKACLQRRNSWSEPVWNSIDIQALGRHDFTLLTARHIPGSFITFSLYVIENAYAPRSKTRICSCARAVSITKRTLTTFCIAKTTAKASLQLKCF